MKKSIYSKQSAKLCQLLTDARTNIGYTQKQLADKLGRPQSFVAKYEHGERRIDVIEFLDIAKILEIDPVGVIKKIL